MSIPIHAITTASRPTPGSAPYRYRQGSWPARLMRNVPRDCAAISRDTKSCVYMCLKLLHILRTWRILASSLRERATVALLTGCGASRTKYRIGSEWRQDDPSGSFIRLWAREGQYGEIKQRDVRAVNRATDLRELIGRRHASLCLHAWVGCRSLTYLHGIVRPPASRLRLSCP